MKQTLILAILILSSLAFSLEVIEPVKKDISGNVILELGEIGPGQTIDVLINPIVSEGGKFNKGGQYDEAIATSLPSSWSSEKSKLYAKPLQVKITAAKDAKPGIYFANITVVDENYGEQLDNITFTAKISIRWDVLDAEVFPSSQNSGPGQPARFDITIKNTGTTSDVFEVSSKGTNRWQLRKFVYLPPKSEKKIKYEVTENEEGTYVHKIAVTSTASDLIKEERDVSVKVVTNIIGDYKATNNGVLLFPIFESLISSIAGIISNLS